jgi:hypothetical protein
VFKIKHNHFSILKFAQFAPQILTSDFSPILKSLAHFLAVAVSSQLMLFWVEMVSNRSKGGEKSLSLSWGFESSHSSFSRSSGLMGVLSSIVQSFMFSVLDIFEDLVFNSFVAFQFICH